MLGGGYKNLTNNKIIFDLRVVVIGDKLLAERRMGRDGDFRASGSGVFEYVKVDEDIQKIAFDIAEQLQMQSVAFDFIFDHNKPLIVEMSYGFGTKGISHCPGYYSRDFQWHESTDFDFCGWMVENLIKTV